MSEFKLSEKMKLRINDFEIEVDGWNIDMNFFWLRKDGDALCMKLKDIKDLKEIIERFEEKLKMKEFKLSEKIEHSAREGHYWDTLLVKDVKEFIRRLKEEFCRCHLVCLTNVKCEHCQFIDKLAGEKLI